MSNRKPHFYFWIDLETTGLDPDNDIILEMAIIVTDSSFNEIMRYHTLTNPMPDSGVDPYVVKMHKKSGLTEDLENQFSFPSKDEVDQDCLDLIESLRVMYELEENPQIHLAGSSVHFDARFLEKNYFFPQILHYRILDVTSIMLAFQANPKWKNKVKRKGNHHRAMDDIETSLAFARYYFSPTFSAKFKRLFRR